MSGIYREVVPDRKLVFRWAWHTTPERESQVTIDIKPDADGTHADPDARAVLQREGARRPRARLGPGLDNLERLFP